MKTALVTLAVGKVPEARWSHPIFAAYARRYGMDFVILDQWRIKKSALICWKRRKRAQFEKLQLHGLLTRYDRILYMDADILLNVSCPDLLAEVPAGSLGVASDESGLGAGKRQEDLARAEIRLGPIGLAGGCHLPYFNSGVMVVPATAREVFDPAQNWPGGLWPEQTGLNYHARRLAIPLFYISVAYNYMPGEGSEWQDVHKRKSAHVVHYAGLADRPKMTEDAPWFLAQWGLG